MTYRFTDYDGEGLSIKRDEEGEGLRVDKFGEGFVWVNNHDAPRIALEILKAAGVCQHDMEDASLADAFNSLKGYLARREEGEREAALMKRRDEIALELAYMPFSHLDGAVGGGIAGNLIDRIIELEDKN